MLAERAGVGDEVAAVTEQAMRGELDFEESLRAAGRPARGTARESPSTRCTTSWCWPPAPARWSGR